MRVSASIKNGYNLHQVIVKTDSSAKVLEIPSKPTGYGSSINGAELLLLSLSTCFCNDIYREAAKRNIKVTDVEVAFTSEFGAEGEPGANFQYKASVVSDAPQSVIDELIRDTDNIAEIHNTLRKGVSITLMK